MTPCSDVGDQIFGGSIEPSETLESYHFFKVTTPWRWRQHGPPKRWYPTTAQHGVTTQRPRLESS